MQWMEIINARMTDPSVHREIKELFGDIHSQMNSKMKQQVKLMIYRNNLIEIPFFTISTRKSVCFQKEDLLIS